MAFIWDGDAMIPRARFKVLCGRQFEIMKEYVLAVVGKRSKTSHDHYFACLDDAWATLPEALAKQFPTREHMRKRCLIWTGFCTYKEVALDTLRDAQVVAELLNQHDEYCLVEISDKSLRVWRAKSQAVAAMKPEEFQASKTAVLGKVAELVGVTVRELTANAGHSA